MLPRIVVVTVLLFSWLLQLAAPAAACGPFSIDPIFVFHESPDLPFHEFTKGKVGIVQPTFGRKTLVIAYRYLNGGFFTEEEQSALVEALKGTAPEENGGDALKTWIAARKELLQENETLPEIYVERKNASYDFFPNCAKNAFEVATATLKDRVASYSATDRNVQNWIAAQDLVFQNCSGGSHIPAPANPGSPKWLLQDRDYQIAAAFFYSLNFKEARRRFERIAADLDSPWQDTATYLIARTLVRQASLSKDEAEKHELNTNAEVALQNLAAQSPSFQASAKKLLALVKFRLHPEERVSELARTLTNVNGNENLRQDLIDYVWLVDRAEAKILEAETKRKEELKPPEERDKQYGTLPDDIKQSQLRYEARERGETISITFAPKNSEGVPDYRNYISRDFKYDAPESEILFAFEEKLNRKLTDDEVKEIRERREADLHYREWLLSPNRKWGPGGMSDHEGWACYDCGTLTSDLIPYYLRADDLTDWILTLQSSDPDGYAHALKRWRDTGSRAWLVTALIKVNKTSPGRDKLMHEAEKVRHDAPEFPSVRHELARLEIALGQTDVARKMIDDVLTNAGDILPLSAKNQFLEQRQSVARGLGDFLQYSQRKPVAFYNNEDGRYGTLLDQFRFAKAAWSPEYSGESKEDYEKGVEEEYKELLPWDERSIFAAKTVDAFNWHFSLEALAGAAHNPSVPSYLQRQLIFAAWTRAILLHRDDVAMQLAPEAIKAAPEMAPLLNEYLRAKPGERDHAALFVLIKFPNLSPFVVSGLPLFNTSEDVDYYFESAWWCELPATEYNAEGHEVQKVVSKPEFLTARQLETAAAERKQIDEVGAGKSYLGKLVLRWAKSSSQDPRVPEALFIAFKANENYKYGCGGWEHNEEIQNEAEALLREKYPGSGWTARLPKMKDR
jgi:hypothetical protein